MSRFYVVARVLILKIILLGILPVAAYDVGYHPSAEEFDNLLRETRRTWTHNLIAAGRRNTDGGFFVPKYKYENVRPHKWVPAHVKKPTYSHNRHESNPNHYENQQSEASVTSSNRVGSELNFNMFSDEASGQDVIRDNGNVATEYPLPVQSDLFSSVATTSRPYTVFSAGQQSEVFPGTIKPNAVKPTFNENTFIESTNSGASFSHDMHTLNKHPPPPPYNNDNSSADQFPIFFSNPVTGIVYAITQVGKQQDNFTQQVNDSTIPIYITKSQYDRDIRLLKQKYGANCQATTIETIQSTPQIIRLPKPPYSKLSISKLPTQIYKPDSVVIQSDLITVSDSVGSLNRRKKKSKTKTKKKKRKNKRPGRKSNKGPLLVSTTKTTIQKPKLPSTTPMTVPYIMWGTNHSAVQPSTSTNILSTQLEKPTTPQTVFSSRPFVAKSGYMTEQYRQPKQTVAYGVGTSVYGQSTKTAKRLSSSIFPSATTAQKNSTYDSSSLRSTTTSNPPPNHRMKKRSITDMGDFSEQTQKLKQNFTEHIRSFSLEPTKSKEQHSPLLVPYTAHTEILQQLEATSSRDPGDHFLTTAQSLSLKSNDTQAFGTFHDRPESTLKSWEQYELNSTNSNKNDTQASPNNFRKSRDQSVVSSVKVDQSAAQNSHRLPTKHSRIVKMGNHTSSSRPIQGNSTVKMVTTTPPIFNSTHNTTSITMDKSLQIDMNKINVSTNTTKKAKKKKNKSKHKKSHKNVQRQTEEGDSLFDFLDMDSDSNDNDYDEDYDDDDYYDDDADDEHDNRKKLHVRPSKSTIIKIPVEPSPLPQKNVEYLPNDNLKEDTSLGNGSSAEEDADFGALEEEQVIDYQQTEASHQENFSPYTKSIVSKKRIRRRPSDSYEDYNDDDDEGSFFSMIFYPVQVAMTRLFSGFGEESEDDEKPQYPIYTQYNNPMQKDDDEEDGQTSSLSSWLGSWFGFNRRTKKIGTTTVAPIEPTEAPGWFESWFGGKAEDSSDDYDEYEKWFYGWFDSKPKVNRRDTAATTTAPTPQVPILTIVDPLKNPQNWIGILAHHIINSTTTTTHNPLMDAITRVTRTTTENPDIPRRISYDKYQIWRLKPQDDAQVKVLEEYKKSDEGVRLQWLKGPSLRGLTDVLVPPKMLVDFQGTLSYEAIAHEVLIFDVGKAIAYEKSKEQYYHSTTQRPGKQHPTASMTWSKYYPYDDIVKYLEATRMRYPQMVELLNIGRSYEGRPLIVVKIESKQASAASVAQHGQHKKLKHKRKSEASGLFLEAGTHGMEWIGPATATWMINELLRIMKSNRTSPEQEFIKHTTWYIMPVLNPDSYVYSHEYDRFWKKSRSRHVSRPKGLINSAMTWLQQRKIPEKICYGVDLDRNWQYQWGRRGSSKTPCNEFYAGPTPFSEPETKALAEFLSDYRKQIKLYISMQAYGQIISYPLRANTSFNSERMDDFLDVAMVGTDRLRKSGSKTRYKVDSTNDLIENRSGCADAFAAYEVGIPFSYTMQLADNGVHGYLLPSSSIEPTAKDAFEIITAMFDYI